MIVFSVILFSVAAVFLILGILLYRGNTHLIHDYHQIHIKDADKKEYAKAFAKAIFPFTISLFISGAAVLFGDSKPFFIASGAVFVIGLIVSAVLIGKVQKKYNGGIF